MRIINSKKWKNFEIPSYTKHICLFLLFSVYGLAITLDPYSRLTFSRISNFSYYALSKGLFCCSDMLSVQNHLIPTKINKTLWLQCAKSWVATFLQCCPIWGSLNQMTPLLHSVPCVRDYTVWLIYSNVIWKNKHTALN